MPTRERIQHERTFHDLQAQDRARTFTRHPERLRFRDADYLDHEPWVRPALAQFGEVAGQRLLDLGCGHGMAAIVLARRGASVLASDLSGQYLAEVRQRARLNEVELDIVQADAHQLPVASASFDGIWGHAILHHLDFEQAARELHRVLKPGGLAVFCEPWGENPLGRFARRWLPYPGKDHTPDETPLVARHLEPFRQQFEDVEWTGYQILGAVGRFGVARKCRQVFNRCDELVFRFAPPLRRWGRYAVISLRKAA